MSDNLQSKVAIGLCKFLPAEYSPTDACPQICCWCWEQAQTVIEIVKQHQDESHDKQPNRINR